MIVCPRCSGQLYDVGSCSFCRNLGWLSDDGSPLQLAMNEEAPPLPRQRPREGPTSEQLKRRAQRVVTDLSWPGIDLERARQACWHLQRAVVVGRLAGPPRVPVDHHGLRAAGEHLRIANGYLGAIGFERGRRLGELLG